MAEARGCLVLGWGQAELALIKPLTDALAARGYRARAFDLTSDGQTAPLDAAREAYVEQAGAFGEAAVCGIGMGASVAMLLAEQYIVSSLVLVAPDMNGGRRAQSLSRLAVRNLFAIVAPTLVVQPESGNKRIVRGISRKTLKTLWLEGQCPLGLPGAARMATIDAILEHLCHAADTNSLAN